MFMIIFNNGIKRRGNVRFKLRSVYPLRRIPRNSSDRRSCGPQNQFGFGGKRKVLGPTENPTPVVQPVSVSYTYTQYL
jgi:hypothetical protein